MATTQISNSRVAVLATRKGIRSGTFSARSWSNLIAQMSRHLKEGQMKSKHHLVVGIEMFPETLLKLFNGGNFGKLVLQVAEG